MAKVTVEERRTWAKLAEAAPADGAPLYVSEANARMTFGRQAREPMLRLLAALTDAEADRDAACIERDMLRAELQAALAERERLAGLLLEARRDIDELARIAGQAICAAGLAPGERLADPFDHALVAAVERLRQERDDARATVKLEQERADRATQNLRDDLAVANRAVRDRNALVEMLRPERQGDELPADVLRRILLERTTEAADALGAFEKTWKAAPPVASASDAAPWPPATAPGSRVCVAALVTNSRGEVLLVRTDKRDGAELPGGNKGEAETWEDAVRREVREETGLDVVLAAAPAVPLNSVPTPGGARAHALVLLARGHAEGKPVAGDDAVEARWFAPDALPALAPLATADAVRAWAAEHAPSIKAIREAREEAARACDEAGWHSMATDLRARLISGSEAAKRAGESPVAPYDRVEARAIAKLEALASLEARS